VNVSKRRKEEDWVMNSCDKERSDSECGCLLGRRWRREFVFDDEARGFGRRLFVVVQNYRTLPYY
jgi:hypothetical protein